MNLKLENLSVEIANRLILKNLNLDVIDHDVVAILGPNGHGKSTLLKTIMNHYDTKCVSGNIFINGINTNNLTTDKIAKLGVYFAMQNPIEIPGLGMLELLRNEASQDNKQISVINLYKLLHQKMKNLNMDQNLLSRNINENFSGGERKKNEILQMQILDSQLILLDEIDSGLDIDAINVIGQVLIEQKQQGKTIMYISHDNKLHDILKPNKVIVIINGEIVEVGDYSLTKTINNLGYQTYAKQKGLTLALDNNDEFLKSINKEYNCGGIK